MPILLFSLIVAALGPEPRVTERAAFVGFSKNNALAAYRLQVEAPRRGGTRDRYGLVVVMLMPERGVGAETVTIFRDTEPVRLNAKGERIRTSKRRLLEANPRYAQARPHSHWVALKRRARFRHRRLPLKDSVLRLSPDEGVQLEANIVTHGGENAIDVVAPPNASVAFGTVVRKLSGEFVSGGDFQMDCPEDGQIEARVEAFHSRDGYSVAVVTTFSIRTSQGVHAVPRIAFSRMIHSPIGTTQIGSWNLAKEVLRWGADQYNLRHPGMERQYERFVGDEVRLRATGPSSL